jgi:peptide deformylase
MSVLNILTFPDPRLRQKAKPVEVFDASLKQLVADMFKTMYQAPGIGLAATQVNVQKRVIVMDVTRQEDKKEPLHFVNPVVTSKTGTQQSTEGCLSVPDVYEEVSRALSVTVEAFDQEGKPFSLEASGLLAVCIQHEIDHLDGRIFVDYLSPLKRALIKKKAKKRGRPGTPHVL